MKTTNESLSPNGYELLLDNVKTKYHLGDKFPMNNKIVAVIVEIDVTSDGQILYAVAYLDSVSREQISIGLRHAWYTDTEIDNLKEYFFENKETVNRYYHKKDMRADNDYFICNR